MPELYLDERESREKNFQKIKKGVEKDLEQLLNSINYKMPVEINIHPFCHVKSLPYKDANLDMFMKILPRLQEIVDEYNKGCKDYQTHLFIGMEGKGYNRKDHKNQIQKWKKIIEKFNWTGKISFT